MHASPGYIHGSETNRIYLVPLLISTPPSVPAEARWPGPAAPSSPRAPSTAPPGGSSAAAPRWSWQGIENGKFSSKFASNWGSISMYFLICLNIVIKRKLRFMKIGSH